MNDAEFGFYFINHHSRLPVLSLRTGSLEGVTTAGAIGGAANPIATAVGTHLGANPGDILGAVAVGTQAGVAAGAPAEASQAIAGATATGGDVAAATQAFAQDAYLSTAQYRVEYPEDIRLYGISFNTVIGATGVALQGEVSHRQDVPLQIDDVELFLAAASPLTSFPSQVN